jgi:murein DD-endopeptidase MepM/ murein hydrolase activator NlpD
LTVTVNKATGQAVYGFMQGMPGSCSSGIHGGGGSGAWIPPVSPGSYTVTQPFAPWHSGIDLAAVLGTAAHAADAGVVVYSGWVPQSWGYGQLVVLDHGNNWTTYYAHLNAINVHCGQSVARGEVVGEVGTTGNSTGTHLHFEMRWNNTPDNPAAYIGL